jgi:hypothetical protein
MEDIFVFSLEIEMDDCEIDADDGSCEFFFIFGRDDKIVSDIVSGKLASDMRIFDAFEIRFAGG